MTEPTKEEILYRKNVKRKIRNGIYPKYTFAKNKKNDRLERGGKYRLTKKVTINGYDPATQKTYSGYKIIPRLTWRRISTEQALCDGAE